MRLIIRGGVALLVAVAAAGCGGSAAGSAPHLDGYRSPAAHSGTTGVRGVVRGYGGPLIPTPTPHPAMDGGGMSGQKVTASAHGKVVAHTTTNSNGRFALKLSRGSYQIKAGCSQVRKVTVHEKKTASITLQCDFP